MFAYQYALDKSPSFIRYLLMSILTKEHYELMQSFEKEFKHERLDKEPKELWPKGVVYQSGNTNQLFLAYRRGYALAKASNPF